MRLQALAQTRAHMQTNTRVHVPTPKHMHSHARKHVRMHIEAEMVMSHPQPYTNAVHHQRGINKNHCASHNARGLARALHICIPTYT